MIVAIILFVISEALSIGLLLNGAPGWLNVVAQAVAFSSGLSMAALHEDTMERIKRLEEDIVVLEKMMVSRSNLQKHKQTK